MSCYHPLLGLPKDYVNANGNVEYNIVGLYDPIANQLNPRSIAIPCGKCIGCRLDYSRSWADRMMLELQHTGKAVFVTLTYDNDHVPIHEDEETGEFGCFSLDKRDLQLFFKRLRKKYSEKEIRYYAAGEYGSNTLRPHYHAIIFGLCLEDFPDRLLRGRNELGQCHYQSDSLQRVWSNGFVLLADVSWKTCAYVARYVQKKVFQGLQFTDLLPGSPIPEFSLVSRRPGLGRYFLDDHPDLFDYSKIFVNGVKDGMQIPKYFLKLLKDKNNPLHDRVKYDSIIQERKKFADDKTFLKMQQTDLSFIEQLEVEENEKLLKVSALKRL